MQEKLDHKISMLAMAFILNNRSLSNHVYELVQVIGIIFYIVVDSFVGTGNTFMWGGICESKQLHVLIILFTLIWSLVKNQLVIFFPNFCCKYHYFGFMAYEIS